MANTMLLDGKEFSITDYRRMQDEMIGREIEWHKNTKALFMLNSDYRNGFNNGMAHTKTLGKQLMDTLEDSNELVTLDGDEEVIFALRKALALARKNKPNDRSEKDRLYAITITDLHKIVSFFDTAVMREDNGGIE